MRVSGQFKRQIIIASLIILTLTINLYPATASPSTSTQPQLTLASPQDPPSLNGTIAVNPSTIGDANNYPIGTQFTVAIKLVNATPINQFKVSIATWPTILNPLSITEGDVFSNIGIMVTRAKCINRLCL